MFITTLVAVVPVLLLGLVMAFALARNIARPRGNWRPLPPTSPGATWAVTSSATERLSAIAGDLNRPVVRYRLQPPGLWPTPPFPEGGVLANTRLRTARAGKRRIVREET